MRILGGRKLFEFANNCAPAEELGSCVQVGILEESGGEVMAIPKMKANYYGQLLAKVHPVVVRPKSRTSGYCLRWKRL